MSDFNIKAKMTTKQTEAQVSFKCFVVFGQCKGTKL